MENGGEGLEPPTREATWPVLLVKALCRKLEDRSGRFRRIAWLHGAVVFIQRPLVVLRPDPRLQITPVNLEDEFNGYAMQ